MTNTVPDTVSAVTAGTDTSKDAKIQAFNRIGAEAEARAAGVPFDEPPRPTPANERRRAELAAFARVADAMRDLARTGS